MDARVPLDRGEGVSRQEIADISESSRNTVITDFPFRERFEGPVFPPTGWSVIDQDGDGLRTSDWRRYEYLASGVAETVPVEGRWMVASRTFDLNFNYQVGFRSDHWFVTPQLVIPSGVEPYLKFWTTVQHWWPDRMEILVSKTGTNIGITGAGPFLNVGQTVGDWTVVRVIMPGYGEWTEVTVPLTGFDGESIYIAFRHNEFDQNFVIIDDVTVQWPVQRDLVAVSLTGSPSGSVNHTLDYTFTVFNRGTLNAGSFIVNLMEVGNSTPLVSLPQTNLGSNETRRITMPWTPTTVGNVQVYAEVLISGDQSPINNRTEIRNIEIFPEGQLTLTFGDWIPQNTDLISESPYNYWGFSSVSQIIYYEHELTPGIINDLMFSIRSIGDVNPNRTSRERVYLAHTDRTHFQTGIGGLSTDSIPFSDFTMVWRGSIPASQPGTHDVHIEF
jgi:hypothetical protein